MSISPINHYALTTAQPGVINEEAYTVLDLVGKCGAKVNECVNAVNEIEDYDDRITAAQETADAAASTARAALTTATENGQRITNVSAVALEGRSVAFSAQSAANAAQDDVDAVENKITVPVVSLPFIQYEKMGEPGQLPELSPVYIGPNGHIPNILQQVFSKFTCDLTQEITTGYTKDFLIKGQDRATTGDFLNGCGKVSICPRNSTGYGTKASFIYEIHIAYMLADNSQQAEPELIDIWGSGSIIRGNYIASDGGIPSLSVFYNKLANWIYNYERV